MLNPLPLSSGGGRDDLPERQFVNPSEGLRQVCEMISAENHAAASEALASAFTTLPAKMARGLVVAGVVVPVSAPPAKTARDSWSKPRRLKVYVGDGFTDRYTGEPLIFPGALRAFSIILPEVFPFHSHWKMSLSHPAYYAYSATIDHVKPLCRDGPDNESNVVSTSQQCNTAKGDWLLSELNWPAEHAPILSGWDGLLPWFCREYERNAMLRGNRDLKEWHKAAKAIA